MKLTLLGTGCPSIDYKRYGSANLICSKKAKILIDCGSGVTQRLNQSGHSSAEIDAFLGFNLALISSNDSPSSTSTSSDS